MKESVLYVVEVLRSDGEWTPAWDGDGAHVSLDVADNYQNDPSLGREETRVAVYVRREDSCQK